MSIGKAQDAKEDIEIPRILPPRPSNTSINIVLDPRVFSNSTYLIDDLTRFFYSSFFPGKIAYGGFYSYDIKVDFLSDHQIQDLSSYLNSIEVRGENNGYQINQSNPKLFEEIRGNSYDAQFTLDWLENNLWDGDMGTYTLFLLNLDELNKHWFTIKPLDLDTGFYSEKFIANTEGLELGKQVSAWGGVDNLPLHYIDISASVWYGEFINSILSSLYQENPLLKNANYFENKSSPDYLIWLKDLLGSFFETIFTNSLFTDRVIENSNLELNGILEVPITILTDIVDYEKHNWMVSEKKLNDTLNKAFPFIDFKVDLDWVMMDQIPDLESQISLYMKDEGNNSYVELNSGFFNYVEQNLISYLYGEISENMLPVTVFFKDKFELRQDNDTVEGFNFIDWQLLSSNPDQIYSDNKRSRGISSLILDKIGHAMGFFHPFYYKDKWVTDFTATVMGYFTNYPDFSVYDKDSLARLYADYYIIQALYLLDNTGDDRDRATGSDKLQKALTKYNVREYASAVIEARESLIAFQSIKMEKSPPYYLLFFPIILIALIVILRRSRKNINRLPSQ
ncbi:MAG: hypothetical protein GPJ54_14650 [Candidatus Heimdallarchaeota archaeon]|nr:hypothetical protein [Candidatus Heimdallarchaeota archaeon]